ncbi:Fic family protein [Acidiphilium sp. JA12-A1]|uniref:Fic/DOC family protein n=1 Tax=Acidiphilium sp. JA12-A1 TaxID=1464546 RepID=UPI00046201B9|nr:Fic family protein [Acidiphilium sp. JA12-A1]KDM65256.1 adenosine monophosphate-protein transferase BepA [Acidiphilium sp. JA12-A1]
MADDTPPHGYTYPNTSDDPDQQDVLRNRFGYRTHSQLRIDEYRITSERLVEIELGHGPAGRFDADHLKDIHRFLFSAVYEWAGHTRDERPIVDGQPVEPVGGLHKGGTSFLHGSRIGMGLEEALRPIREPESLKNTTYAEFAGVGGRVLSELNYVHPFREGNGRTQEAVIAELGRHVGHDVDFSVISKPRMIAASIAAVNDPDHPAMRELVEDAVDPARARALREAFSSLRQHGENPYEHDVRTARPGEMVSGTVLGKGDDTASLVTQHGIVAVPIAELSPAQLAREDDVTVTVRSGFAARADARRTSRAAETDPSDQARAYWQRAAESGAAIRQAERQARAGEGQGAGEEVASRPGRYRAR